MCTCSSLWRVPHKFYQSIYIFNKAKEKRERESVCKGEREGDLNLFNLFWCFDEKGIMMDYAKMCTFAAFERKRKNLVKQIVEPRFCNIKSPSLSSSSSHIQTKLNGKRLTGMNALKAKQVWEPQMWTNIRIIFNIETED